MLQGGSTVTTGRERDWLLGAYFTPQDAELIKATARDRGEPVASFIRRAVFKELSQLSLLGRERVKALGLAGEQGG